jgi:hypothetical protein
MPKGHGQADYLSFADEQAAGAIEANRTLVQHAHAKATTVSGRSGAARSV